MAVVPVRLLTIEEYAALGETEVGYTELVEGRVVISPNPGAMHNRLAFSLAVQLDPQLPPGLTVILGLDIDLQLAPATKPASHVGPTCWFSTEPRSRAVTRRYSAPTRWSSWSRSCRRARSAPTTR
ncbi:hypothetical protein [Amycolatopsis mediterranei]|uniref:hypothetical protein n=1 Tax=Amycolatopsis mediterranei TaxID=33910 RepID=UPI003F4DEE0C